jgi:chemotaxis protein histidine kinase CheA
MKSLFSQLAALLKDDDPDESAVFSLLEDMERVTNYVGHEGISRFLKDLCQGLKDEGGQGLAGDRAASLLSGLADRLSSELDISFEVDMDQAEGTEGLMEEDQELYEIFLDFFEQTGAPLANVPDDPNEAWLKDASEAAGKLKNSAHYMDYAEVVEILESWQERAEKLLEHPGGTTSEWETERAFFLSLWDRLKGVLPDLDRIFGAKGAEKRPETAVGAEDDPTDAGKEAAADGGDIEEMIEKEVEGLFDELAPSFDGQTPDSSEAVRPAGGEDEGALKEGAAGVKSGAGASSGEDQGAEDQGAMDELDSAIDSLFDQAAVKATGMVTDQVRPGSSRHSPSSASSEESIFTPQKGPDSGSDRGASAMTSQLQETAGPKDRGLPGTDMAGAGVGDLIKVDLSKVESLLGDVGELVVLRSSLVQAAEQLKAIYAQWLDERLLSTSELRPLKEVLLKVTENASALERVVHQLQDGVMRIRMLPVSHLFNRYPRMVRDISRRLNKQVELTIYGADTALDKQVMEQLADPMQHLVRNALDHGIEQPQDRLRAGKPAQGRLVISASQEGNNVVIMVSDDGRCLNREAIVKKAVEKGIIRPAEAQAMSAAQVWNLIFLPGMTTAERVSDLSGRGVGLDVVRSNIERMGGSISVNSEPGKGTIFMLRIPLTLAIIKGLVVRVGSQAMVVPVAAVQETFRISPDEISHIEGYEIISVRQQTLPLIRLGKIFRGTGSTGDADRIFAIRISQGEDEVCLGVDELVGQQEVVIKPLSEYLTDQPGFSGATILGDGSIALILDLPAMLNKARNFVRKRQELMEQEALASAGIPTDGLTLH